MASGDRFPDAEGFGIDERKPESVRLGKFNHTKLTTGYPSLPSSSLSARRGPTRAAAAHRRICYNSCRNRHCPQCQAAAAKEWLADRQAELLPVPYFHVVFTLPGPIADIANQNNTDLISR